VIQADDREAALAALAMRRFFRATPLLMAGKRVGLWTLLDFQPGVRTTGPRANPSWLCRCACGEERSVRVDNLRARKSTSCGMKGCRDGKPPAEAPRA
jgi:hypothetical protein